MTFPGGVWLLPTQAAWVTDPWHLRIKEKSRQVGATKTDALDSVLKASPADARFDVWVTSRDDIQARLYLEDCMDWAKILHLAATYLGVLLLDSQNNFSAHVLQFANGRRIYCLSSNPNALAGKRGHVKIDEFALPKPTAPPRPSSRSLPQTSANSWPRPTLPPSAQASSPTLTNSPALSTRWSAGPRVASNASSTITITRTALARPPGKKSCS